MTAFEFFYYLGRPLEHPLYQRVFRILSGLQRGAGHRVKVLDVGGRRSNYTIGLDAAIWISELPRESAIQHNLDLGATEEMRRRVLARRTNIEKYVYDDMTRSELPRESFDVVVAVEVLEHVDDEAAFLRNVVGVLRPQGWFVATTPNGDFLPIPYPDHKRHYRREEFVELLRSHFHEVDVRYAVNAGRLITLGVRKPSVRAPLGSLVGIVSLGLSYWLERAGSGGSGPEGKRHLVAVARKRSGQCGV